MSRANSAKIIPKESANLSFQESKTSFMKIKKKKDVSFTLAR